MPHRIVRGITRTPWGRYVVSLAGALLGVALWLGTRSLVSAHAPLQTVLLLGPVVGGYVGGVGPGLAATILSGLALLVWSPSALTGAERAVSFLALLGVGAFVSWISDRLHLMAHAAEAEAAAARGHAEAREGLERRLHGIVQCEMLGIGFWSENGEITEPNDALLRMLGYSREDVASVPLRWMSMAPRAQFARGLRALSEIRDRGYCTPFETTFQRKDGVRVPVLVGGGSINGTPGAGAFFVLDMTKTRQIAEALRATERRYRLVAESMHDIVSLHEVDSRVVFISPSVQDRLGWEPEKVVGRTIDEFVHPDERTKLARVLAEAAAGQRAKAAVWRCRGHYGGWHWLETNFTLVSDDAAETGRRLLCTSRDVTDRKSLEEQLRQAQRMEAIGRLAGGVAHDFNNLLTVILGYASQLELELEEADTDGSIPAVAAEIRTAAERASRLTQQLLAFSRQQVLQPRVVNLNESVRSATSMLQRLVGPNVQLELALEEGLWTVLVDPGQVEQVLMNLVVNARDAMPRGGTITIHSRTERLVSPRQRQGVSIAAGDWTVIEVSDTGEGMPPAIVSRIFEPFFTTKALGQGTGLGLSMVYGIVKQSGGFIFCDSHPGQGTTMCVYLPRALAAVEQSLPGSVLISARGGTVLVVEDESAIRSLLTSVLRRSGYVVHEAASGAEALDQLASLPHLDLLITDVVMPEMSGVDLARRCLAVRPGTPVLYISGYADEVLNHEDVVPGSAFIQKPFRPDVLTSKVRDIVEGLATPRR